jgi:hypothetical protein
MSEEIEFHWRKPLDFVYELIADPSLSPFSHFHAVCKHLFNAGHKIWMVDEPWTGNTWYDVEVSDRRDHISSMHTTYLMFLQRANYLAILAVLNRFFCHYTYGWTKVT